MQGINLDVVLTVKEELLWFEISVAYSTEVQKLNALDQLFEVVPSKAFIERASQPNEFQNVATSQEFRGNVEPLILLYSILVQSVASTQDL